MPSNLTEKAHNPTAALLIIGNEILSGRTQDTNLKYLAEKLLTKGVKLAEVRVVPDIEAKIITALNELRANVDYVFTTGGIGPTHDDITAESVAKAFNVPLDQNEEARAILKNYYGDEQELTEARLRMARIPRGAQLVLNPVSGAPGFQIENVFVMAGVPRIMQSMLDDIIPRLESGDQIFSLTIASLNIAESVMAEPLERIQNEYPSIEIGSYPQYRSGVFAVSFVLRGTDINLMNEAKEKIKTEILKRNGSIQAE